MAEFPALPLFTDAYLGDTMHLDATEHGAYLLLLICAWRTDSTTLPDDDKLLARYARCTPKTWQRVRPILAEFFTVSDGKWRQERLSEEKLIAARRRDRAADNGRLSALKRKERHSTKRPTERERSEQLQFNEATNYGLTPNPNPNPNPTVLEAAPLKQARGKFDLPDDIPADAWAGYEEMRKRKRAPMTDRARQGVVAKLRKLSEDGHSPGDVLDQSTNNSWTDVYALKEDYRNGRHQSGNVSGAGQPRGLTAAIRKAQAMYPPDYDQ